MPMLPTRYGKPHSTYEYAELTDKIREDMAEYDVVVTRDEFNHWLASHDALLDTLEDAEIDLSCKSDLFDVLDADMSGELEFEEMIDGLLKCRGPASKTDIIAIRWVLLVPFPFATFPPKKSCIQFILQIRAVHSGRAHTVHAQTVHTHTHAEKKRKCTHTVKNLVQVFRCVSSRLFHSSTLQDKRIKIQKQDVMIYLVARVVAGSKLACWFGCRRQFAPNLEYTTCKRRTIQSTQIIKTYYKKNTIKEALCLLLSMNCSDTPRTFPLFLHCPAMKLAGKEILWFCICQAESSICTWRFSACVQTTSKHSSNNSWKKRWQKRGIAMWILVPTHKTPRFRPVFCCSWHFPF